MLPVKRFIDFVEHNSLFNSGSNVLVALSGGMDSVLMTHLLKAAGYKFGIAHCNFQLRGDEAAADEQFSTQTALQLQVPFHSVKFDTRAYADEKKISIQMAARELRYQWFDQVRQQNSYDVIALAHHQNDTIETILLNLTRGTGIAGLHGILPKNNFLVRPMLCLNRDEIKEIVRINNIAYVEDSSNTSVKYARNKIRLEVIPKLKELNPGLENTFERNLRYFKELEVLLQQRLIKIKKDLCIYKGDEIHISIQGVKNLNPQFLLLYGLLQEYGFNESTIDDIISSLDKHSGRVFEAIGYLMILDREVLILKKREMSKTEAKQIRSQDTEMDFGQFKLNMLHDDSPLIVKGNDRAISVDAELLIYPLTLRTWIQSDFFYPFGMKTRKKLSDFFINQKVPLHEKDEIPLLVNGNGDIVWVCGYRLDDRYRVNDNTKKVTIFELYK